MFEDVSADFFHYAGRDFLVYVDRLSGWPVVFHFPKGTTTSRYTIYACRRAFVELGVPVRFRSDGGPQFASRQFNQFLKRWGVSAAPSTPNYHQSNGHAEAAVKAMKKTHCNNNRERRSRRREFPARTSRISQHSSCRRSFPCTNTLRTSIAISSTCTPAIVCKQVAKNGG